MITGTEARRFCAASISGVEATTFEVSPASLLVGAVVENPDSGGILAERQSGDSVLFLLDQLRRVPRHRSACSASASISANEPSFIVRLRRVGLTAGLSGPQRRYAHDHRPGQWQKRHY